MADLVSIFTPFEWVLIVLAGALALGTCFFVQRSQADGPARSGEHGVWVTFDFAGNNGCSGDGGDGGD